MYNKNKYLISYLEAKIKDLHNKNNSYSKGQLTAYKNVLYLINNGLV